MSAPARYVSWINSNIGFNPRGQAHSNALCSYINDDLRTRIPLLKQSLDSGLLVFELNMDVPPGGGPRSRNIDMGYRQTQEGHVVTLAVENKTTMTAHGRARKNRLGDLLAYSMHLHAHYPKAVAGFTIVINSAERYKNPDQFSEVAKHKAILKPRELEGTIQLFREVPLRKSHEDPGDLPEALAIIVVAYDGRSAARLVDETPPLGTPNHYESFLDLMRHHYLDRFSHE